MPNFEACVTCNILPHAVGVSIEHASGAYLQLHLLCPEV